MYSKHTRPLTTHTEGDDEQTRGTTVSRTYLAQPEGESHNEERIVDSQRGIKQNQYRLQRAKEDNRSDGKTFKAGNVERETKQQHYSYNDVTNGDIIGLTSDIKTSNTGTQRPDESVNPLQSKARPYSARVSRTPETTYNTEKDTVRWTGSKVRPCSAKSSSSSSEKVEITEKTDRKERPNSAKESDPSIDREPRAADLIQNVRRQRPSSSKQDYTVNDGSQKTTREISDLDRVPNTCCSRPSSGVKGASLSRPLSGIRGGLSSRPSSGIRGGLSSRPSSGVKGASCSRPSSGVKGASRPVSAKINEPRTYSSFYSVVDTLAKIRHWSKQKYRNRKRNRELNDHSQNASNESSKLVRRSKTISALQEQHNMEEEEEREKIRKTRTFWWYCKVIKAVVKLALDMQKLSMQKTEQTPISEMYYINVAGPSIQEDGAEENQILFFDKSWFSRKRATSRVPEWAQATTLKSPEKRTEEEVRHLHNFLLNMRSFKEKFTEEMRLKICQAIRYTKCDKGRVILRQGHLGLDFYFIFSGSVFIQIDIEDKQTGTITTSTENVIRHGESFGEIALLGDDGKRSACVICREPTELFTLDKATFLDVCPGIFEKELQVKTTFARQFPLFQNWEAESVEQLCFNSQVIYVPHGRTVDLDWSTSNFVYFVMKGRISLLREFDVSDMYNMTALGMMDKEIHFRYTETNRRKRQVACIGWLHEGDASELRILSLEPSSTIESITMLSEGVKVFRVAVRTFKRLAPRRIVEDYLKKSYVPREIPCNADICEKVFKDNIWAEYKRKVLTETVMQGRNMNISQVPATSKGSSGWARWPGYDVNANVKTSKLSDRSARSELNVFEFINVSPVRGKFASPEDTHRNMRKEDKSKRQLYKRPPESKPPVPEPVVLTNDRSMISRPHPVRNIFELRANANRMKKKIELNESNSRQLDSGKSTKSVFLTAPNNE